MIGKPTRRSVLAGGVTAGFAAVALPAPALSVPSAAATFDSKVLTPDPRLTVNREQVYRVMKNYGIDVIVGVMEVNARYLTNMRSIYVDLGRKNRIIGVMTANPDDPVIAILPSGFDVQRYADPEISSRQLATYSYVRNLDDYEGRDTLSLDDEPQPGSPYDREIAEGAVLSPTEQMWAKAASKLAPKEAATAELALRRVLRDIAIKKSVIAIDDAGVERTLTRYGMGGLLLCRWPQYFSAHPQG